MSHYSFYFFCIIHCSVKVLVISFDTHVFQHFILHGLSLMCLCSSRRSIIGGANTQIFLFFIMNFFCNQLYLNCVNTTIWECDIFPLCLIFCSGWYACRYIILIVGVNDCDVIGVCAMTISRHLKNDCGNFFI